MSIVKTSKITFVCGPMFAGKTSYIIHKIMENVIKKKHVLVITSVIDNRYEENNSVDNPLIKSHDTLVLNLKNPYIKHIQTKNLMDVAGEILNNNNNSDNDRANYKNIFIDEVQFFPDIEKFCQFIETVPNLNIVMSGLDTDFRKNDFNGIEKIYKYCDKIKKMHAMCGICKFNNAIYSKRISNSSEVIDIGGEDKYIPTCRICHDN